MIKLFRTILTWTNVGKKWENICNTSDLSTWLTGLEQTSDSVLAEDTDKIEKLPNLYRSWCCFPVKIKI